MRFAKVKEDLLFFLIVVPLFLILVLFSYLFFSREERFNRQVLEYETGRLASDLLELVERSRGGEIGTLRPDVLGFGLYGREGPLFRYGSAPAEVPDWRRENERFSFRYRVNRLVLVRPVGFLPMMGRGRIQGRGMMHEMMQEQGSPVPREVPLPRAEGRPDRFLLLEIDIDEWQKRQKPLAFGVVVIPALFFAALWGVAILYRRNRQYRFREERNRQLLELGEAARTLTHEIKNPLGAIKIQTAMLKKLLPPENQKGLGIIDEETERLRHLADRIGEFLRDPVGTPERIELSAFLRGLVSRFPGAPVFRPSAEDDLFISFDPHRLRTVVENLLRNAVESSEGSAGAAAPVEIEARTDGGKAIVRILDRGRGLPEGAGVKIFDPFFTTKIKGSGIGLAVSKRFVEAAGGRLVLKARKGGGTEAAVVLPREGKA